MGLLRTILVIIIIYYGLQIISKYILPIVLKKAVNKVQDNMKNQFEQHQKQQQKPNEPVGKTSVDFAPKSESSNNKVGEYIDFEEVKPKNSKEE